MNVRPWTFAMIAAAVPALVGCCVVKPTPAPATVVQEPPPPALIAPSGAVAASIKAMGGIEAWQNVQTVTYDAVVTFYNDGGTAHVDRHRQAIDLINWTLTASSTRPAGAWQAVVDPEGKVAFHPAPARESDLQTLLTNALPMVLERAPGVLNLVSVHTSQRPGRQSRARIDGIDAIRVAAAGDGWAKAYYLDRGSNLLQFATSGGDAPGQSGTITRYTFTRLGKDMRFPSRIEVFAIGQNTLLGEKKILDMDLLNIRLTPRPPAPAAAAPAPAR
ncbi:MAG: hypothetical protein ABFD92_13000 [Planctomycetaceae bacterium]|nr:hypothetical protein [Planctomycetaceae bacterium]